MDILGEIKGVVSLGSVFYQVGSSPVGFCADMCFDLVNLAPVPVDCPQAGVGLRAPPPPAGPR